MRTLARRGWSVSAALAAIFLSACGGPSVRTKKTLNSLLAARDFVAAEAQIRKVKDTQYKRKNAVLYYLDLGTVQHHAGKYRESDRSFAEAERRMEELYTKSVTKAAGALLINDMTMDYAGEPFERALAHVFRALNYVYLGEKDEALVEARKVEVFLDELNSRMKKRAYRDDAFARYLDSLLYADSGEMDDARISYRAAMKAYSSYQANYNTATPRFKFPERDGTPRGEVVFIHYNGVAPRKISRTFQVAWNEAMFHVNLMKSKNDAEVKSAKFQNALRAGITGKSITVSYPEYIQDKFTIVGSEVIAGRSSTSTRLMEDISAIAFKDLKDRVGMIKSRSIARALVKYVIAQSATKAVKKKHGAGWGLLTQIATNVAAAATEVADTRGWATVPSQIRMARLKLPVGRHDLSARFLNGAGMVVATHDFRDVRVEKGTRTYLHYRTAQ